MNSFLYIHRCFNFNACNKKKQTPSRKISNKDTKAILNLRSVYDKHTNTVLTLQAPTPQNGQTNSNNSPDLV